MKPSRWHIWMTFIAFTWISCNKDKSLTPSVLTLPVSFIGTSFAISGGNVTSNGFPPITQRGLCWNKMGSPTIYDSIVIVSGDTGVFVGTMSGLELGVKYFVKAFVQTKNTVVYGSELNFITYNSYFSDTGTFVDNRDLTPYKWVKIGNQIWMAENLKYLANGIKAYVPNFSDASYGRLFVGTRPIKDIQAAKLSENYKLYGCLYVPKQNICPQGWHIPSKKEWLTLINFLGGESIAGGLLKESGTINWKTPNSGGTNKSLFGALPAGTVYTKGLDEYTGINTASYFYTSDTCYIAINNNSERVYIGSKPYYNVWGYRSIRCVKD